MSTKASSLNASANNSPTNSTMNTTSTTTAAAAAAAATTPTVVKIKKELPSDEIKEFAESTMNELLGWYGFDNVDRLDLSAKTSKLLQTAGILNAQQQASHHQHHHQSHHPSHNLEKRRSRSSRTASLLHLQQHQQQNEHLRSLNSNNNSNSINHNNNSHNNSNNNCNNSNNNSSSSSNNRKSLLNCSNNNNNNNNNNNSSNNYRCNDSTTSDHDTRSSRDDDSKSPNSAGKATHSTTMNLNDDKIVDYQNCCWCRRPVPENAPEFLTTSDGPRYCSESCFTQSRRASFKKAKTCDWCKHVRHAVSYVDFQDGASQLQFCSDKCLNQYKMQIFCKETQAHLDMNPHLKEQGLEAANNGANLITPDLWLRNCRSRSASPASTVSISPGPPREMSVTTTEDRGRALSPPLNPRIAMNNNLTPNSNASHKPLISVAPVSKLMSKSPSILANRQSPKHNRKKRPVRSCVSAEMTGNRSGEVKTNSTANLNPSHIKPKPLMAALSENSRNNLNQSNSLTQFAASCVQDLHMNVPPLSPMLEGQTSQPTTPHSLPPTPHRGSTAIPPAFFATPPNTQTAQPQQPGFHPRPPPSFMPNPNAGFLPRFLGNFAPNLPPHAGPVPGLMQPDLSAFNALIGTPPPVTVMVPYPVIIPLPIPIPVPLPIVDFYKAHLTPEERKKFEEEQKMKKERETSNTKEEVAKEVTEEPLDFTKSKDLDPEEECNTSKESLREKDLTKETNKIQEEVKNSSKEKEEAIIENTTINSEDSSSPSKNLHCVVTSEEIDTNTDRISSSSGKLKSDFVASTPEPNEDSNDLVNSNGEREVNQKLPKLKITRLQTKRTLIQTKESECSRPLRKRKRIIDCDFQKLNATSAKESNDLDEDINNATATTTENESSINKGQNTNNNSSNSSNKK